MTTYRNTDSAWGDAGEILQVRDYDYQARLFTRYGTKEQRGAGPSVITFDEEHVYADGEPVADRVDD